jgi:hypothetical protein
MSAAAVHLLEFSIDLILKWTALAIEYLLEFDFAVNCLLRCLWIMATPICVLVLKDCTVRC